ncbi:Ltp family lipoprotein [Mycolicibacterium setense]|uniref:Ltp family lipoprotein n=1 Tax=Mycolicibacterium setense TaxID=431269 RepID=UPI000AE389DC|nr:Ltp family lipoprotein [Mycolicibacterium setense]MCV7115513.1 Ltp family lipoprotein [Mycolicibacterium setense]
MTTYQVKTAATLHHMTSRTMTRKSLLGALAVGTLLPFGGTTLWSAQATSGGLDVAAPAVQLAGAVTSIEEHREPHVRALSGPMVPLEPAPTVSQRNAVRAAKDYLDYSAFSRQGLIEQLEYEDFSTTDATFAVDSITVDWNEQAAKAAKAYLDYSAFSRGGLIEQLEYEGFTPAQAVYGATAAGL